MQAPPPAGRTGRAPPAPPLGSPGDGGAGATLAEALIVLLSGLPTAPRPPTAKASAAVPPHNAATALALRSVIVRDSSFWAPEVHRRNAAGQCDASLEGRIGGAHIICE
jgi:hypothetical protein